MDGTELARRIGYRFARPELLRQALTHRSHGSPHNERLEFLGDAVLNCAVARELFHAWPQLPEGDLSLLRAHLVRQQTLFELADGLGLGEQILLGEGELKSGGQRRPSILADALEALFGAVFLDGGYAAAQAVIAALYAPLLAALDPGALGKDPKTRLQEFLQARRLALPRYLVTATEGEAHAQQFRVECVIEELGIRARGAGASRRAAEQEAAREAYEQAAGTRPD